MYVTNYIRAYICIYVLNYVLAYMYVDPCTCMHARTYLSAYVHENVTSMIAKGVEMIKKQTHQTSSRNDMYICMYTYTHIHTCNVYIHTHVPVHTYIQTYTNIYTYTKTYINTYTDTYIQTYIQTYTHTHIHTNIHKYINTYTHTHIHTYTHTHQCSRWDFLWWCCTTNITVCTTNRGSNFNFAPPSIVILNYHETTRY